MLKRYLLIAAFVASAVGPRAFAGTPAVAAEYELDLNLEGNARVALTVGDAGLAVFAWNTFENEPFPGGLAVMVGKHKPLVLPGVWSAALDGEWKRVAVGEQVKIVDNTVDPPYSRMELYCRTLKLGAADIEGMMYYDGFAGNGYVTRVVTYEVGGKREPHAFVGGDFLDWAGDDGLIVGREIGNNKTPGVSGLALYGYELGTGAATFLGEGVEANAKLAGKLSADVRASPYLPAAWSAVAGLGVQPGFLPPSIEIPSRGGSFENLEGATAWMGADNSVKVVGNGLVVAVSRDGTWVLGVRNVEKRGLRLIAYRLTW